MFPTSSNTDVRYAHHKIKRKPPPTIDVQELYPSPDPADPFAPLWLLRNRTSSALGHNPFTGPITAPLPIRANSQDSLNKSAQSTVPRPPLTKESHYRPYSQAGFRVDEPVQSSVPDAPTQIFPSALERVTKRGRFETHIRTQPRRSTFDTTFDSSGTETESDISVHPRFDIKAVRQSTVEGLSTPHTHLKRGGSENSIPTPLGQRQGRLAKLLSPSRKSTVIKNTEIVDEISGGYKKRGKHLERAHMPGTVPAITHESAKDSRAFTTTIYDEPISLPQRNVSSTLVGGYLSDSDRDSKENSTTSRRHKDTLDGSALARILVENSYNSSRTLHDVDSDFQDSDEKSSSDLDGYKTASTPLTTPTPGGIDLVGLSQLHTTLPSPPCPLKQDALTRKSGQETIGQERLPAQACTQENISSVPVLAPGPTGLAPVQSRNPLPLLPSPFPPQLPSKVSREKTKPKRPTDTTPKTSNHPTSTSTLKTTRTSSQSPQAPASTRVLAMPSPQATLQPPKLFHRRGSGDTVQDGSLPLPAGGSLVAMASTHSISNSSLVNISIPSPAPSLCATQPHEGEGAYVSPRPAPKPPLRSRERPKKTERGYESSTSAPEKGFPERTSLMSDQSFVDAVKHIEEFMCTTSDSDGKAKVANNTLAVHSAQDATVGRKSKFLGKPPGDLLDRSDIAATVKEHGQQVTKESSKHSSPSMNTISNNGEAKDNKHDLYPTPSGPVSFPSATDSRKLRAKQKKKTSLPPIPVNSHETVIVKPAPASQAPTQSHALHCPSDNIPDADYVHPTPKQIALAGSLHVYGQDGKRVSFGSLFAHQKTVVVFIRHFWCPLCQDYMSVVSSLVKPEMLVSSSDVNDDDEVVWKMDQRKQSSNKNHHDKRGEEKIGFVVISNGAPGMIAKYRQIFALPFEVYTDPSLALYKALGMGKDGDCVSPKERSHHRHYHRLRERGDSSAGMSGSEKEEKKKGYVKHGLMSGIAMVVVRAIRVGMPVWEKGGDVSQLGGEFVFGPGISCSYAHRMRTTKGHAPIQEVLQAAGVNVPSHTGISRSLSSLGHMIPTSQSMCPTSSSGEKPKRKRRESSTTLRESVHRSSTMPIKFDDQGTIVRQDSRRYSIGMMSREDEDLWMQARQKSIEALQERKTTRRVGTLNTQTESGPNAGIHRQHIVDNKAQRKPSKGPTTHRPLEEERIVYRVDSQFQTHTIHQDTRTSTVRSQSRKHTFSRQRG